jgi:hypothetical protein
MALLLLSRIVVLAAALASGILQKWLGESIGEMRGTYGRAETFAAVVLLA